LTRKTQIIISTCLLIDFYYSNILFDLSGHWVGINFDGSGKCLNPTYQSLILTIFLLSNESLQIPILNYLNSLSYYLKHINMNLTFIHRNIFKLGVYNLKLCKFKECIGEWFLSQYIFISNITNNPISMMFNKKWGYINVGK
jgi:hypothetical protein